MTTTATFDGDTASVPAARRFVRRALSDLGADDYEYAAGLVVSELATNAVIHARGPFRVTVEVNGDRRVRLAVSDGSRRSPITKAHSADATTGRGLGLVAAMADEWGVERHGTGKTVWVLLRPSQEADASQPIVWDLDLAPLADDAESEPDARPHHGGAAPGPGPSLQLLGA